MIYESTSFIVFKDDPQSVEVRINESSVIELSNYNGEELKANKLRIYMDPALMSERVRLVLDKLG